MRYLFRDYALDNDRRELKRDSELISVGPQVFDLLLYLVQNRERVVTKDDLLETVWSGRLVAQSTLNSHMNAARKAVGDSGEQQLLIRTVARKGFRFVGEVREEEFAPTRPPRRYPLEGEPTSQPATPLALPDRPSIAVLPFDNMSGDPAQEYFGDGIVEDIITALSRMRWLFVIARNSSFAYKGRSVDARQVGRDLGVRYLLEGSVRKASNRVRITYQLIEAATGTHLWAERFDGTLEDIFELQDQVATSVVLAISPRLEQAEIIRAKKKPTDSLDAYDCFLQGMWSFNKRSLEATSNALRLFSKAVELDPEFASAYGMAAWCYVWRKLNGWTEDRVLETSEGRRLARKAVELGNDDAVALARGGHAFGFLARDFDTGVALLDRALLLNPNLATAWVLSGLLRNYGGEPEVAIEHLARAMRYSPLDPTLYHMQTGTGFGHFLTGRFKDALPWAGKAFREEPNYVPALAVLAASHAQAGQLAEAQEAMAHLRQVAPLMRLSIFPGLFRRPEHLALWVDGLRKAGLPE